MKIKVIAIGKLKENFYKEACDMYLARLRHYVDVEVVEIMEQDDKASSIEELLSLEAKLILKGIPNDSDIRALAIEGKAIDSIGFSRRIEKAQIDGTKNLVFIIGGSNGLSNKVTNEANELISLGKITLPHNLARVVLLEQIYRAYKIIKNEPYHK